MAGAKCSSVIVIVACAAIIVGAEHQQQQQEDVAQHVRIKRQFNHGRPFRGHPHEDDGSDYFDPAFYQRDQQWPTLRPQRQAVDESSLGHNELIFSNNGPTPPPQLTTSEPGLWVLINNRPELATLAPFTAATTPSTEYRNCFSNCQTTNEYNPVCGSNQQLYFNEQKFNCARSCGSDIQIVRRGSCEGLFAMQRG